MQAIFNLIQENPKITSFVILASNSVWALFMYFYGQWHERKLEGLKSSLKFKSDKRLKLFELKASQYEAYVEKLDAFGKRHQVDLPRKVNAALEEFLADSFTTGDVDGGSEGHDAVRLFSSRISRLLSEGAEDYRRIQAESHKLKLTATDSMLDEFEVLESLTKQAMHESAKFMGDFVHLAISNNFQAMEDYNLQAQNTAIKIKESSERLFKLMRFELNVA